MKNSLPPSMPAPGSLLLWAFLLAAIFAISPRSTPAQAPQTRSEKCANLIRRVKVAKESVVDQRSQRAAIRSLQGELARQIRDFPQRKQEFSRRLEELEVRERKLDISIGDAEKDFNALVEQLADCCCPEKPATETGPDVPGLDDEVGAVPFKRHEAVGLFSLIREDSTPKFNTYGFNGVYTHYVAPSVGITGSVNGHFRDQSSTELSKFAVLGGVTLVPFDGVKTTNKATFSLHALGGVSHFRSKSAMNRFSANSFTLNLGVALDFNVTKNLFIRPFQFDYAPTFFGNATQHNAQFGSGLGFRF